jgi:hypothetical protein
MMATDRWGESNSHRNLSTQRDHESHTAKENPVETRSCGIEKLHGALLFPHCNHYFPILVSILLIIHEITKSVESAVNITNGFLRPAVLSR